ncbi:5-(carboxyamino)imidazole ribonucleotide mutase [Candidatus Roizmanbacteria bacterium RIFCSPLOWO2_12_FULL_40_12]|uniref:N5-carboxyaminoimidazole ribonucleotide mutase n=1 Tax=Candidatus Roizmanbacteria bacterium RIFCSPLOWO2_01_FULL_40_42 TaxID=1802066 RepID=A0A1F7J6P9_9BACT|nr:MAG: 5-(carboxyamino)imidazole ribonucleotide mutase [Candidatus Roizmanbacteria bacterium RIFCSPHIGHO2_01_FULL_40_98]OGK27189.1 MAG: 5-(carboxyamino)imidazole ribonucleotide mutase [Candidatus Roizmanbacteria bacterium RIFCSPHIGHO2_02_FULL_40_53]OGK30062.1 MAG: 5-(carboxyamino)imidazole ribonucleotide mutase [Candidatus Roizmanbacteria bacterium RIFCSPHIGHO2_12_41_18]OGK36062.1 MAG: 5-(carboxyamino)imidazole ribonucleotide mutase [Candidatus Roizmanbacteria bacterium RIFCSPHIGHO2_12_FULL_40_
MKSQVAIIMGSDSDLPVMQDAAMVLDQFRISYELTIVSAHRTPDRVKSYIKKAERKGIKVIIAAAGGSAHLPGMSAAFTHLPVIGVPIKTKTMDGLDSLLSIVQMPPGVPVATVAVNGAKNAALLAIQILSSKKPSFSKKIKKFKKSMNKEVLKKASKLEKIKYKKYLKG